MENVYYIVVDYFDQLDELLKYGEIDSDNFSTFLGFNRYRFRIRYRRGCTEYGDYLNLFFIFRKLFNLIKYY